VINISDVINFKGRSMAELKREFAKSIATYFEFCRFSARRSRGA
jgi:predicted HicB family RNase H-like nuclease